MILTNDEAIEILVQGIKRRGLSDHTLRFYPKIVASFAEWLADQNGESALLVTATQDDFDKYLDYLISRNVKRRSIKTYFYALTTLYDMLVYKKHITTNPVIPVTRQYLRNGKKQH